MTRRWSENSSSWYTHRSGETWPRVRLSFMVDKIIYPITSSLYRLALSGHVVRHVRGWRGLQRWPWLMEPEQLRDRDSHAYHSSTSFQHVAGAAHEILKMTSTSVRSSLIRSSVKNYIYTTRKLKGHSPVICIGKSWSKCWSLISILQARIEIGEKVAFRRRRDDNVQGGTRPLSSSWWNNYIKRIFYYQWK